MPSAFLNLLGRRVLLLDGAMGSTLQSMPLTVEGDYLGKVASKFDVTVGALDAANASTPGYSSFYVGLEIVIPAKSDC